MNALRRIAALGMLVCVCTPGVAFAQRELHWDRLAVEARLDSAGRLEVTETQVMVFTGDWNGGERKFNLRPHQTLSLTGIARAYGGEFRNLSLSSQPVRVDDYTWADPRTLRWRSRLQTDPPFDRTPITYVLRYQLSGILLKADDQYLLDHDFAFPDRSGTINQFELRLALDPAWQPLTDVRKVYLASGLAPRQRFVLTIPLRYTGAGHPLSREVPSRLAILTAVSIVLGATALAVLAFFAREQAYGRFAQVSRDEINETWIAEHLLTHPAEEIGAAWDDSIGPPEVVALLARMVAERKLESDVLSDSSATSSMTLRLKVDPSTLEGHERALVDALFFDGRTETSTADVQTHYRNLGKAFDPANVIRPDLEKRVSLLLEAGDPPRLIGLVNLVWFLACLGTLILAWYAGGANGSHAFYIGGGAIVAAGIARAAGVLFRSRMDWGRTAAVVCLLPALSVAAVTATFLWMFVGKGATDFPLLMLVAIVALSLWLTYTSIRGLKSRPSPAAIALRKKLTAARKFFSWQLAQPHPALRNEWYPWVLAFGLGERADAWSTQPELRDEEPDDRTRFPREDSVGRTSSSEWTGFGGGRSGGAGASAGWSVAAAGMAAPIAAPKSSWSDSSSDSSSSGGSSSSSGSSGGGGGGGW